LRSRAVLRYRRDNRAPDDRVRVADDHLRGPDDPIVTAAGAGNRRDRYPPGQPAATSKEDELMSVHGIGCAWKTVLDMLQRRGSIGDRAELPLDALACTHSVLTNYTTRSWAKTTPRGVVAVRAQTAARDPARAPGVVSDVDRRRHNLQGTSQVMPSGAAKPRCVRPRAALRATFVAAALVAGLTALSAALGGCGGDEERHRAEAIGGEATARLMSTLQDELRAALREGGPAAGVTVCAGKAQKLTAAVARALEVPGLQIKRTSTKVRNPRNAPDAAETAVLADYARLAADGAELAPRLVATNDGYRYYAPIRVGGVCLACHGAEPEIAPEVRALIEERYPQDAATGYALDEFRGVVRVTIPATAVRRSAQREG
jgi:hypothetical protein